MPVPEPLASMLVRCALHAAARRNATGADQILATRISAVRELKSSGDGRAPVRLTSGDIAGAGSASPVPAESPHSATAQNG